MSYITRYIFDRIPALADLRGVARLNAEEVIENAVDDAIDDYLENCEVDGQESVRDALVRDALVRDARARALYRARVRP